MIRWPALAACVALSAAPPAAPLPEAVVQKQVEAYNAHDLNAFAACYAQDIEFRTMAGAVNPEKGLAALKKGYGELFKNYPSLRVKILNRITQGAFVIDELTRSAAPLRERERERGAEPDEAAWGGIDAEDGHAPRSDDR